MSAELVELELASSEAPERIGLSGEWQADVYRQWSFAEDVLVSWRRLARAAGDAGVFIGPGWFEAWVAAFSAEKQSFIVVLREAGDIRAILPFGLVARDAAVGRYDFSSLTNDHTCHYDFLIEPGQGHRVGGPIRLLLRRLTGVEEMAFGYLAPDSNAHLILREVLSTSRTPAHEEQAPCAPFLELKGNWDGLLAQLPGRLRNSLKRCRKKAEQKGKVRFDVFQRGSELEPMLDDIFAVEYNSWKGRAGTAIKCSQNVERFYRGLCRWAMGEGLLLLYVLRLDGRPIAGSLCLRSGSTVYLLKPGYDESLASLSPGTLLQAEILRHLYDDPSITIYNFLGATDPWKLEWTSSWSELVSVRAFNRSMTGWIKYLTTYGWKDVLKRSDLITRVYAAARGRRHE
jgi:CelD/BcsL family acetyltransferase involved in cellulose biosynthesis